MKFINQTKPDYELTYSDVFILPADKTTINSRMDIDTTTYDGLSLSTPVIIANMNAVAGKRMAESTARRGAMTMLVQNLPIEKIRQTVDEIKSAHPIFETPITCHPEDSIQSIYNLISKRSHGTAVVIDEDSIPIGIFSKSDANKSDPLSPISSVMNKEIVSFDASQDIRSMFDRMVASRIHIAPVTFEGKLLGVVTKQGIVRSTLHKPALDNNDRLKVGVALGINEDIEARVASLEKIGVDAILIDTANGHQERLLEAVKRARSVSEGIYIIAGTVVTAEGTKNILEAGANMVKVGIGAGATCITRMRTGVGRPQFSAVLECAEAAKKAGGFVLADAGIRHPRDVALALAAGASCVMVGSWFAPTYESATEILSDEHGEYVEQYGMASSRAVLGRIQDEDEFSKMKKSFFEEGSNNVKMYLKPGSESAEDIIDQIMSGVRSTCSYVDARSLQELHDKAIIGIQSPSAYQEGQAVVGNW